MIIAILYLIVFLSTTNNMILVGLIPKISTDFLIEPKEIGYLNGIYGLMSALFNFIAGPISDKIGRKKILEISTLIFSFSIILCSFSWNYQSLFIFRLISGIAASPIIAASYSYIADSSRQDQIGHKYGILSSAMFLGSILGVPLANTISYYFHWKISFLVLGFLTLMSGLIIPFWFKSIPTGREEIPLKLKLIFQNYVQLLKKPFVIWLLILMVFLYSIVNAPSVYIGLWLTTLYSLNLQEVGYFFMISGAFAFLGSILTGKMLRKYDLFSILLIATALSFIASLLYLKNGSLNYFVILYAFLTLGGAIRLVCMQTLSNRIQSSQRGSMSALFTGSGLAGGTIGPVLGGFYLQQTSFKTNGDGFTFLMAFCGIGFIISFWFIGKLKIHQNP